jgi:hypothetical protein
MAATSAVRGDTEDGEVARLGAPASEDDPAGRGAGELGHLLARVVENSASGACGAVRAGGVPDGAAQVRGHRLEDLWTTRRRCGVVEVEQCRVAVGCRRRVHLRVRHVAATKNVFTLVNSWIPCAPSSRP